MYDLIEKFGKESNKIEEEQKELPIRMILFQGPFFISDFNIRKIVNKIVKESQKQNATLVMIRGPVLSQDFQPYLLIKERKSMNSIKKEFLKLIERSFEDKNEIKVIFVENGEDPSCLSDYPLEVSTKMFSNTNQISTSSEEFSLSGMYFSFTGYDPMSLAWDFVKSNRHSCKGNLKKKMLISICDQKSRCPLTPSSSFIDPRNTGRCHTFGKPLDLLIMCSRKYSSIEQCGSKMIMSTQPFVTRLGFREYSLLSISPSSSLLRIEIHTAENDD